MSIAEKLLNGEEKLAVLGLGYVGLPLAVTFAKKIPVIGFDLNAEKIQRYREGIDPTNEVGNEALRNTAMRFTVEEEALREALFFIVAVPTPIDKNNLPDLSAMEKACGSIGRNLRQGAIVMFESTVYPGTTEDICIPILEKISGYTCGVDFFVGYSPERVNPGDKVHRLDNIVKLVAGMDRATALEAAAVYEIIMTAGVKVVSGIKVAEVAKLAENTQRDVNIAFMNELSMTLSRMDISTKDVIDAMNTKWNALGFRPGLVGGHCISVDPYYLIYKAEEVKGASQLVQSSRKINNGMSRYAADMVIRQLIKGGRLVKGAKVYIMGITYKANCPDTRNTMVPGIAERLREYGVEVRLFDPVADKEGVAKELGIDLVEGEAIGNGDCLVFAVAHQEFASLSTAALQAMYRNPGQGPYILIDIPGMFDKEEMEEQGFLYWSM